MTKEALGQLILDSDEALYRIAKSILYNDADCADAIQNTIVKAFSKLYSLRKEEYARTWLIRILINECKQILRTGKKVISLEGYWEMQEPVSKAPEAGEFMDLYEAIMSLNEQDRISIELYYMEGYNIKEIADILHSTESAIKKRLVRAREKLRTDLKEVYHYGY